VEAERIMLGNTTKKPEAAQALQGMLEKLRELLVREPSDLGMIKECMSDLRKETQRFDAKVRGI